MTRRAARITHDEVCRLVKAVSACGLPICQVTFDGNQVRLVIGEDNGERSKESIDGAANRNGLIREPEL